MKKELKAGSKKKPAPPGDPLDLGSKYRPGKSPSKLKSKKGYRARKSVDESRETLASKLKKAKAIPRSKLETKAIDGEKLASEYLRYRKPPSLESELFNHIRLEIGAGDRSMNPHAQLLLQGKIREASTYLKSKGSQPAEIERTKVLLKIFAQSFPIVSTPISAATMQRKMKRWLPCPPFCKER